MSDFIAAACVGVTQVTVGHPFDTAKVLIQNKKKWAGLPIRDYYRGWRFPLIGSILFNCTVFPTYERTLKYTNSCAISGAVAGLIISPVVFCFEVGTIKQQTKQNLHNFFQTKGKYSVFARETIAMSTYFSIYNYAKKKEVHTLTAGGAAGLANWTITYPVDVVKSRQIAQNISIRSAIKQGNLWKGYPICAARAMVVNAANFWVYETVKNLLEESN